ncbi:MAG TPA: pilin [Candidatus Saccharimonadales bacterium]|nr:pilin [Candidatus Saccharimonadales bacterium]
MKLLAQGEPNLNTIQQKANLTTSVFGVGTTLGDIINKAIPWIFTISGMILLIYLIFGGIQLMLSGGDPKNAGAAKAHITNALVGFIIIFVSFWIVQLVGVIFGLSGVTSVFK